MAFIKEESEDIKIEETFRVKQEDTEEHTDLLTLKEESQELNEIEENDQYEKHDVTKREKSIKTETSFSQKRARKTGTGSFFSCFQCGKSFKQHASLRTHMGIHNGEKPFHKPFVCEQCGKGFKLKVSLKNHMRIHSGDNRFTCHQCKKSFCSKDSLGRHDTSHWREVLHMQRVRQRFHT